VSPLIPTRHPHLLLAALAALLALAMALLAACDGTQPPTPSPTPTSTTNHDIHAFPELEARLPQSISGQLLTTVSLAAHPDRQDPKTLAMLARLNRTANDLQLANGELVGFDLEVGAMRIVGAPGTDIIAAFRAVDEADPNHRALYTATTIGDKSVTARTVDAESTFLYGAEDIMFILHGDLALVEAALAQLP
jgi:hypothetical protein